MTMDLSEFYGTFFDEAGELLQDMETQLLALDLNNPDDEALNAIFRAAHSIKGGAATFGVFDQLVQTTHKFENVLDEVRNHRLSITREAIDIFLRGKDILADQVNAYRNENKPDEHAAEVLIEELNGLLNAPGQLTSLAVQAGIKENEKAEVSTEIPEGEGKFVLEITFIGVSEADRLVLKKELQLMGEFLCESADEHKFTYQLLTDVDVPTIEAICGFVINDDQLQVSRRPQADKPANDEAETHANKPVPASTLATKSFNLGDNATQSKDSGTIRVSTQRVDQLVNQVGEVVIEQSILFQACEKLDSIEHADLLQGIEQMSNTLRELQESVMALRMVTMDYAFGRFPRVVRETASKLKKQIELKTVGGNTEMDKGIIEKLIDPLTHLIRNSLDHGIETPQIRVSKGKDPVGKIEIAAFHEGGRIVVEVKDDGAGLNREKILAKAIERGMSVSPAMCDSDVFSLIFAPGFSTAQVVTDVSGRGVGMDVVRRNIQEIGGNVQIDSVQDKGTKLRISLPLTLAIVDGMTIQTGVERFVLPLDHISECLQPDSDQLHNIGNLGWILNLRGEHLPILSLGKLFDIQGAAQSLEQSILIVVQVLQKRYALAVDQLLGQHQVVVKSLEKHYKRVPGTSGATILGDGSVALILDAATLLGADTA